MHACAACVKKLKPSDWIHNVNFNEMDGHEY
jgi:hypothetical protein